MAKPNQPPEDFQKIFRMVAKGLADGLAQGLSQAMQQVIQPLIDSQMNSTVTNPYILLGVSQGSSKDEVAKRYKDLMRIYHPDTGAGNDTMCKLINQAWQQIKQERGW